MKSVHYSTTGHYSLSLSESISPFAVTHSRPAATSISVKEIDNAAASGWLLTIRVAGYWLHRNNKKNKIQPALISLSPRAIYIQKNRKQFISTFVHILPNTCSSHHSCFQYLSVYEGCNVLAIFISHSLSFHLAVVSVHCFSERRHPLRSSCPVTSV